VHPFHPLAGHEFELITAREGLPEDRVYFEDHQGRWASIPLRFTDLTAPDPAVVLGPERCHFRLVDLLALLDLMERRRP
jgi:Family of unknown function (DUF5372)